MFCESGSLCAITVTREDAARPMETHADATARLAAPLLGAYGEPLRTPDGALQWLLWGGEVGFSWDGTSACLSYANGTAVAVALRQPNTGPSL